MPKMASQAELRKQEKHIATLEDKKVDLSEKTRENNKGIRVATIALRCMITGEDPTLFDGEAADDGSEDGDAPAKGARKGPKSTKAAAGE